MSNFLIVYFLIGGVVSLIGALSVRVVLFQKDSENMDDELVEEALSISGKNAIGVSVVIIIMWPLVVLMIISKMIARIGE